MECDVGRGSRLMVRGSTISESAKTDMPRILFVMTNSAMETNLGDHLIHDTLLNLLAPYGELATLCDPSSNDSRAPIWTFHTRLLKSALLRSTKHTHVYLVLPPGQGLRKSWSTAPKVVVWLTYLGLLKVAGIHILRLGFGIPSSGAISRFCERLIAPLCQIYSVRDQDGLQRAKDWGIRHAVWFPDLSWLSPEAKADSFRPFAERHAVVLCFRGSREGNAPDRTLAAALQDRLGVLLAEAESVGYNNFILVHHDAQDRNMTKALADRYGSAFCMRVEENALQIDDISRIYGEAAIVLSNRLHALLLGLQWGGIGVAVVDAPGQPKIHDQFRELGMVDLIVDIAGPTVETGVIRGALKKRELVSEAVTRYRRKSLAAARTNLGVLFQQ